MNGPFLGISGPGRGISGPIRGINASFLGINGPCTRCITAADSTAQLDLVDGAVFGGDAGEVVGGVDWFAADFLDEGFGGVAFALGVDFFC